MHGATDEGGDKVVSNPTRVPDLLATMAAQLGMNPDDTESTAIGRPISSPTAARPSAQSSPEPAGCPWTGADMARTAAPSERCGEFAERSSGT